MSYSNWRPGVFLREIDATVPSEIEDETYRRHRREQDYRAIVSDYGAPIREFIAQLEAYPGKIIIASMFPDRDAYGGHYRIYRGEYFISLGSRLPRADADRIAAIMTERHAFVDPLGGGDRVEKLKQLRKLLVKESKDLEEQFPDDKEMSSCLDYAIDKVDELFGDDVKDGK